MYSVVSLFGSNFWEKDFILNELLPEGYELKIYEHSDVTIEPVDKLVIIFSSSCTSIQRMKQICEYSKPTIVIQLSDEFGRFPQYTELSKYCKLYARNYYHANYPNVDALYIPLGYNSNMISQKSTDITHIPSSSRTLAWSFIGEIRENRKTMISFFQRLNLGLPYCMKKGVCPSEMFSVYSHTIFVPSERGHVSLDCFRIYEACVAGAIPVVVGNPHELASTFAKEENPPWIFANNWRNAVMICLTLFRNRPQLDQKQQEVIQWWKKRVQSVQSKFLGVLQ
jgi:hypothetical protein